MSNEQWTMDNDVDACHGELRENLNCRYFIIGWGDVPRNTYHSSFK